MRLSVNRESKVQQCRYLITKSLYILCCSHGSVIDRVTHYTCMYNVQYFSLIHIIVIV